MEKLLIGTNWKMHKTIAEGVEYCNKLSTMIKHCDERLQFFIIPPHTSLFPIKKHLESIHSSILLGSQNMHWENEGAYTGEISPIMLNEIGIDIIELGHSERREYYNENDNDLNKKVVAALKYNIAPLLCIGESSLQKNNGISEEVIAAQLKTCLKGIAPNQVNNLWIAYEPIWAIGEGGIEAPADYVHQMHHFIRQTLVQLLNEKGNTIPILFGGSVNITNAISYLKGKEVNGLFIGRSAWDLNKFAPILDEINNYLKEK